MSGKTLVRRYQMILLDVMSITDDQRMNNPEFVDQPVSRRIDSSFQGNMSVRPDGSGGLGHSQGSAGMLGNGYSTPSAAHTDEQVMSPSTNSWGIQGVQGLQGPSSFTAANGNVAGREVEEDDIMVVERSTFEDLISQFNTTQGRTAEVAQQAGENHWLLQRTI